MKSILVATANGEQMGSLTGLLEKNGYFVIPASDSGHALVCLNRLQIDALIVDHQIDEFTRLLRAVRAHKKNPPRVIAMSERVSVTNYLDALAAGAYDFFFWPIRACEFLRIVRTALRENVSRSPESGERDIVVSGSDLRSGVDHFL